MKTLWLVISTVFFILYLPLTRINRNFEHMKSVYGHWATEFDEAIWSLLVVNIYV